MVKTTSCVVYCPQGICNINTLLIHCTFHYRDLLDEKDIKSITSTMVGHQTRLLVTIGYGYLGVTDRLIEPLMSFRDRQENFVLLWVINS